MLIQVDLRELDGAEIEEDRVAAVAGALGIEDHADVPGALAKLGQASLIEYVEMLAGNGMPNRADEAKQNRLLYVIKKYYGSRIPTESEISTIFQLATSQSRTLLRNTISRYRTRLREELTSTLRTLLRSAEQNQHGSWDVVIESDNMVEQLNLIVAKEGPALNPVRKRSDAARQYLISPDTHQLLSDHLGL